MGVEFRLGRQDGHKAEDFLARRPTGVSAVTLDTVYNRYQLDAADAALEAGVDVLFDPATERMTDVGFDPPGIGYFDGEPFDVNVLATNTSTRGQLVEGVLDAHPERTTLVTPPHFHVHDARTASLNVALAEESVRHSDKPIRAALVISRRFAVAEAQRLALEYVEAGVTALELRITPLGGDNESVSKIRSVFGVADSFTAAGIEIVLGFSGNIGQAAVALGHAAHYSVGVGLREQVNHAGVISRQKAPPRDETQDDASAGRFGAVAGIYLPGPAVTLGRKAGRALLENTDLRTRIGCRTGSCGHSVSGPALDPREHYLHARASEMESLLVRPSAWRATFEIERLRRALELREMINANYLTSDVRPLNTRTVRSLIDDIEVERAA